jgi:Cu/Ag efflux protein CusF
MKKAIAIVLSVMFVFALSTVTFAAEKKEAAPQAEKKMEKKMEKKAKKAGRMKISGEIAAVDAKANTVTVKEGEKTVTLSVDEKTVIKAGKEKKTLADLKAGDNVHVVYTEADGKSVAKRIALKGEKGAKMMEKKMEKKHKKKSAEKKNAASEAPAPEKGKAGGY